MKFNILATANFAKEYKKLSKRYRSLKTDLSQLYDLLEEDPKQGTLITEDCYKVRLAIKSKGRGKSKGARVITHVKFVHEQVYLLSIYDKADQSTIQDHEIKDLLKQLK